MPPGLIRVCRFKDLDALTLYRILQLRIDVFVVEQLCPYRDLDGVDLLSTTWHLWIEADQAPLAYLRLYPGTGDSDWIGRVVTASAHRRRGLGGRLMEHAMGLTERPLRISAQERLVPWYGRHGFDICGSGYLEDGMPHVPMLRHPREARQRAPGRP